ncbi:MAG TPA: metallophosphoesterase [Oscillatoriaceae cyanobacterium]
MIRRVGLALTGVLALAGAASASLPVQFFGGAWARTGQDSIRLWANSPQARLAIDNRGGHEFDNLSVSWQNLMPGAFLATPQGVVLGSSRDGSELSTQLSVPPGERQEWALHPNVNGDYRFAVIGDTANRETGARTFGELSREMAREHIHFALHLGNAVTEGNPHQMQIFQDQLKSFPFPTYVLPGDRDLQGHGAAAWQKLFGGLPLCFHVAHDTFVLLDDAHGTLSVSERVWLVRTLAAESAAHPAHLFVFLHEPPVDPRPGINRTMAPREAHWLLDLFKRAHVSAVFAGHVPLYARHTYDGVQYVTTGGGGEALWGRPRTGGFYHFVRVDVTPDSLQITPVALN